MRLPSSVRNVPGAPRAQVLGHNLLDRLMEWWPLSEQSGARLGVHAGLHLTDNNTVTGADGVGSLASQFTAAATEYLSRASEAAFQVGDFDFTWAGWGYFTSVATNPRLIAKRANGTTAHEYDLFHGGSTNIGFQCRTAAGTAFGVDGTVGEISTDVWFFFAAWHDAAADTINIQVNANAPVSAATSGQIPTTGASELRFGELEQVTRPLDGRMQRVGFWKRVLTSDELAWLYNGGRGRSYPFI